MDDFESSTSDGSQSEDFEVRLTALKNNWKTALKRNKKSLLRCPNYGRCGFKCGSVGGMTYHFVRCAGNPPEFKCAQCSRSYESRTGLNYHMASFHSSDPSPEDQKNESSVRPQRSAALTTMTAIHIANNLPPLKQTFHKPQLSHKTTPPSSTHNTTPPKKSTSPVSGRKTTSPAAAAKATSLLKTPPAQHKHPSSPTLKTTPPEKITPHLPVSMETHYHSEQSMVKIQPTIMLPKRKATPPPPLPLQLITEPLVISPKKSPLLSPSLKLMNKPPQKPDGGDKGGKKGRYITIPSIEYPDEYKSFLPLWRQEMKMNTIIKCPNFSECEFKCTTVNGMKYHYVRCMKTNPPEFNCELCEKRFQCRTGLVWHLKKTHKMIDIQPSKTGYKGTLPIELKFDSDLEDDDDEQLLESFQLPPVISPVRKKIKLEEPWRRQRRSGGSLSGFNADGEDSALDSSAQSGSDGDDEGELSCDDRPTSRRRIRKAPFPRRTAAILLQNLVFSRVPPKPKLGPETLKFHVPSVEFLISDEIATDVDPKPSTILSLGLEALEWQKMYSDSESESDYNPEYDDTGRAINYQSNSSVSDSDEEFMCSLSRKKTTSQRGSRPRGGGGGGDVGRGKSRRGRGAKTTAEPTNKNVPMFVKPPEDMNYGSLLEPRVQPPPPILIKHQTQAMADSVVTEDTRTAEIRVARLPSVPALVKTLDRSSGHDSSDIEEFDRLTNVTVVPPSQPSIHPPHHIQPPPSLVMPSSVSGTSSPAANQHHSSSSTASQRRREPPPLVKNTDNNKPPTDSSHTTARPQIIRLSPSEPQQQKRTVSGSTQSSLSYTIVTQAPQPSYSIVTQKNASATSSVPGTTPTTVDGRGAQQQQPAPPKPRRPGRPRKDQSVTLSTGLRTSAKTVRLGGGARSQQRATVGRSTRGGHASAPTTKKGMKMTQYEFENVSFPSTIGHAQPLQAQPAQQPHIFQVASGAGVALNTQSLVTPLQIIPAGSIPAYHSVSGGGMLLMQGAPQGVALAAAPNSHDASAASIFTHGGNTYQLVQAAPVLTADQADNAQKVSVIMHPATGVATPVQYITQFDGPPPPPPKRGKGRTRSELKRKFEEERQKERVKLQGSPRASLKLKPSPFTTSAGEVGATRDSSSGHSAEMIMSKELEEYFKMEETRRTQTTAASVSDGSTQTTAASLSGNSTAGGARRRPHPATASPNSTGLSTEMRETGTCTTPTTTTQREEEEGEGVSTDKKNKKTRTKRKSTLGKRTSARGRVQEETDPVTLPSQSKLSRTDAMETPTDAAVTVIAAAIEEEGEEGAGEELLEPVETEDRGTSTSRRRRGRGGKGNMVSPKAKLACSECGKEYFSYGSLQKHRKVAHHVGQVKLSANSTLQECMAEWRIKLKHQKNITCPKCCSYRGSSINAIKYHWERCGKSKEELAIYCPHCNKAFKSAGGLNYHVRTQHFKSETAADNEPPASGKPEGSSSTDVEMPSPYSGRKAARVAAERLGEITKDIQTTPTQLSDVVMSSSGFTQDEMTTFRLKIERDRSMECPVEKCKRVFKSYQGLRYHLKNHADSMSLKCPACSKVLAGKKRLENHVKSKHADLSFDLLNLDDCEYEPGVDDDIPGDEEFTEDLEAEQTTKTTTKRKRTTLLIADAPVTLRQYQSMLKEKVEQLFSHAHCEDGEQVRRTKSHRMAEDWVEVQDSELASYLPTTKRSMSYSNEGKGEASLVDSTLPLFGAEEESDGGAAVFFCGGPVWAADWFFLKEEDSIEHYLALSAYRDYDETFPINMQLSHKGLIQLWNAGNLSGIPSSCSSPEPPQMKLGIAHEFGCIRAIKAYPHSSGLVGVAKEEAPLHLGVLALACSDGCVRILNVPHPSCLPFAVSSVNRSTAARTEDQYGSSDPSILFVKPRVVSALLVPSGLGVEDHSNFGQCLCVDWFPGNKHMRIAAGYYNGYVCIWDICSSPLLNSVSPPSSARQQLHPLIQIVGQSEPCRTLAWCPHDSNYIVTGGHDKCLTLWDIRQPFSPVDKQEKGFISYEIVWPLLWCHTLLLHDSSVGVSHSHGIQHCSYLFRPPHVSNKLVTSNFGPLASMSYSDWTDRVAASSFSGEVSATSFDLNYHVTVASKNFLTSNTDQHKTVRHCYTKLLKDSSDEVGDESLSTSHSPPSSMKEKARTHKMVFSCNPPPHLKPGSYQPDSFPLATFTKVCWNPNQQTSDWLLLATNSGLVQLLHLPRN